MSACATDVSCLYGACPDVARRRYGAEVGHRGGRNAADSNSSGSVGRRPAWFKELGVRVLIAAVARAAARHERGIEVLLSCAPKEAHFAWVVVRVRRGAAAADAAAARIETMWHCGACAAFGVGDDGDGDDVNGRAWTCECERAGAGAGERIGFGIAPRPTKLGPAWSGALASAAFASKMLERAVAGDGACRVEPATTSLLRRLAREASDAADVALFRSVDACVDRATGEHPNVDALVDALRREGRVASRTHFDARGVKTDASGEELRCVLYTGPHTTALAWWTPILKDFCRRLSSPTPPFQSPPSAPLNSI